MLNFEVLPPFQRQARVWFGGDPPKTKKRTDSNGLCVWFFLGPWIFGPGEPLGWVVRADRAGSHFFLSCTFSRMELMVCFVLCICGVWIAPFFSEVCFFALAHRPTQVLAS